MAMGEGRFRRLVLWGDAINFWNIDRPISLMIAWKKLIGTFGVYRREA